FRTDAGVAVDVTAATPLSVAVDNSKVTAALPDVAAGTWSVVLTIDPDGAADTYTGTDVLTVYETRAGAATCVAPPSFVPGSITVRPTSTTRALVSWVRSMSPVALGIAAYEVQRSADGTTWSTLVTVSPSTSRVTVSLTEALTHQYRVAAVNGEDVRGAGSAPSSGLVVVTTPSAPQALGTTSAARAVQLSWAAPASDGNAPVTIYRIQRSMDGVTWQSVKWVRSSVVSTRVGGLRVGRTYYFRVAAVNQKGQSVWSSPVVGSAT
ncbi:MAG: hypothetical protein RI900_1355, partial [Actinomycetota bacterium]